MLQYINAPPPLSESDVPPVPRVDNHDPDSHDDLRELLCTEEEVFKLLQSIDTTKASGPDRISGKMLKAAVQLLQSHIPSQRFSINQ